jgi:hypothetical protein
MLANILSPLFVPQRSFSFVSSDIANIRPRRKNFTIHFPDTYVNILPINIVPNIPVPKTSNIPLPNRVW